MANQNVVKGVGAARRVLGWLTDNADRLGIGGFFRRVLQGGRKVGAWQVGHGPSGGGISQEGPK